MAARSKSTRRLGWLALAGLAGVGVWVVRSRRGGTAGLLEDWPAVTPTRPPNREPEPQTEPRGFAAVAVDEPAASVAETATPPLGLALPDAAADTGPVATVSVPPAEPGDAEAAGAVGVDPADTAGPDAAPDPDAGSGGVVPAGANPGAISAETDAAPDAAVPPDAGPDESDVVPTSVDPAAVPAETAGASDAAGPASAGPVESGVVPAAGDASVDPAAPTQPDGQDVAADATPPAASGLSGQALFAPPDAAEPIAGRPSPTPRPRRTSGGPGFGHSPGSAPALPDGSAPGPEYTIKGNAGSMLFHRPDSPYYTRTKAQVWFRTATDARAAGFTEWVPKNRAESSS